MLAPPTDKLKPAGVSSLKQEPPDSAGDEPNPIRARKDRAFWGLGPLGGSQSFACSLLKYFVRSKVSLQSVFSGLSQGFEDVVLGNSPG